MEQKLENRKVLQSWIRLKS